MGGKSLLYGAVVLSALLVMAPVAASHPVPVEYPQLEPNEGPAEAVDVSPRWLDGLRDDTGGPKIEEPTKILGVTVQRDKDYYAVDLAKGDALHITLVHEHPSRILDVAILDPTRSRLTSSASNSVRVKRDNNRIHEELSIRAQQSGTYYIRVDGTPNRAVPYRIEIDDRYEDNDNRQSAQPLNPSYRRCMYSVSKIPPRNSMTYSDLMVSTYEQDYYVLDLDKGDTLNVTLNYTASDHIGSESTERVDPMSSGDEDDADDVHGEYSEHPFRMILVPQRESPPSEGRGYQNPSVEEPGSTIDYQVTKAGKHYLIVKRARNQPWKTNVSARYSMQVRLHPSGTGQDCAAPELDGQVTGALDQSSDVPGMGWLFGSDAVLVTVDGPENVRYLVELEAGSIRSYERVAEPGRQTVDYKISVSNQTLRDIAEADDRAQAFKRAYRSGRIDVTPVGTFNKIKYVAADTVYKLWTSIG